MSRFRNILVPNDFSPHAAEALEIAIEMAKESGAKLHLLHVFRIPMEVLSPYEIPMPKALVDDVRRTASARLEQAAEPARAAGLDAELELDVGTPAEAIVARAAAIPADLIVMGTRGLSGLKHVVLGSVAERVLRMAQCPVLTVKADS